MTFSRLKLWRVDLSEVFLDWLSQQPACYEILICLGELHLNSVHQKNL